MTTPNLPVTTKNPENIHQNALNALTAGQMLLNKSYVSELGNYAMQPFNSADIKPITANAGVRIYQVERIVLGNKQSALESLTAAYTALGSAGHSAFLLLKGDGKATNVYLGVKAANPFGGYDAGQLLTQVFKGHFAGSHISEVSHVERMLYELNQSENSNSPTVTALTGVPSLSIDEREHFIQGLEHFIDAAEGQVYQALILATPISNQQLDLIQRGYEGVATQLSPLLKRSWSFGENESESVSLSISESITHSFGTSLSLTETKGTSSTVTKGTNETFTTGTSSGESSASAMSKVASIGLTAVGAVAGIALAPVTGGASVVAAVGLGASAGGLLASAFQKTENYGKNEGHSTGTNYSKAIGTNNATAKGFATNKNTAHGKASQSSESTTIGTSKQISLEILDKSIEQLINKAEQQIERVEEARRYGGWHSAAYFIADTSVSSRALASIFLGLMRGADSNSEDFALTTWQKEQSKMVLPWLVNLSHPRVQAKFSAVPNLDYVTPATLVSGKEMAIQLSLPRRSTSTVSVVEAQAFGRQVQSVDKEKDKEKVDVQPKKTVYLGKIRHLWTETEQKVELDVKKLSSHIFVTGSTGSGKSNTVYQLLSELNRNNVKFMVIEPTKGEYKNVFGYREDVAVFGTNPKKTKLLRINPFKFPEDIHVLEHIDRLVEIFNVCWPMYAAMPVVLKDAMLEAYKASGWDLETSCNPHPNLFPSFADLLTQLKNVIDNSAFSQEVRSNYEGSLVTRVKSLTNGLNGQIFSNNEIDNRLLFDENVIVDLSRVGSQETKSLIMGILVMRLNEHRMSESDRMNADLKHVTVLEEAHNILKRTSTEQSSEGSNVAGKAVEMLSNAIAEMRTYGEGFIIADQSPSAVDMSAIRNTNTKIIMRLPDEEDRRLAGKAAGVTDDQLEELARLPKGVAVIYQNDWLEPILCNVEYFKTKEKLFIEPEQLDSTEERKQFKTQLAELLFHKKISEHKKINVEEVKRVIEKSDLPIKHKNYLYKVISHLEQGMVPSLVQQADGYLIDLYQRLVREHIEQTLPDLPDEIQQYVSKFC